MSAKYSSLMTYANIRTGRTLCLILTLSAMLCSLALPAEFKSEAAPAKVQSKLSQPIAAVPTRAQVEESYGKTPLSFEPNFGQMHPDVRFFSRAPGYNLFLTANEAVFVLQAQRSVEEANNLTEPRESSSSLLNSRLQTQDSRPTRAVALRMKMVGANTGTQALGLDELPGKLNYFTGNDPQKWRTEIPTFGSVRYNHVYPGVDLVYHGAGQRELEYDFVVAPGMDSRVIQLEFAGAERVEVDASGALLIHTEAGVVRQGKPVTYQETDVGRQLVESGYVLGENGRVGFEVEDYDIGKPLVIDPVVNLSQLAFSTLLGGSSDDRGYDIAVDTVGNTYVTGYTDSPLYPTTAGALNQTYNGGFSDVFITKLNASGTGLIYSTFIGGSDFEIGTDIAVDAAGNAYITGYVGDGVTDYPTTAGAFDTTYNGGGNDVFVTKLNASGAALVYSTFIGGSSFDTGNGIAVDASGNAYITGSTSSPLYPTTAGAFDTTLDGSNDIIVTKLNASGTALLYSTFIGGNNFDQCLGIAIDAEGSAYVTGYTEGPSYPTTAGAFDSTHNGIYDVFVTKLNASGAALVYSTYIGGSDSEFAEGIAVDAAGNAYVTGSTVDAVTTDYPTTAGAFDTTHNGVVYDAFVTKLNASGTALVYSTFIGGNSDEAGYDIAVDAAGNAYVMGGAFDAVTDYPTTAGAFDTTHNGSNDVFVTKLNTLGTALLYSTFIGGSGNDTGFGIAVDAAGNAYATGFTFAGLPGYPTTSNAFQPLHNGISDVFVSKLGDYSIAGRSISASGVPISGTLVSLSGPISANVMTDSEGFFGFIDTIPGENFVVTATRGSTVFNPALFNISSLNGNRELVFVGTANAPTGYPGGQLRINGPNYQVSENGTSVTLTVERVSIISADTVTVNYSTANGTALSGTDFQQTQGTLIFNPLEPTKTITIPISNDAQLESLESFTVSLSNPSGGAVLLPQSTALVAIKDDDISSGNLLISEFRMRGTQGASDEFVEIYNNTDIDVTVNAADGSNGWTLAALSADGQTITPRFTLPAGLTIPARGHYLGTNTNGQGGYSLPDYPTGSGARSIGDATFTTDIADNTGLALLRTSNPANFTAANLLDAVGFAGTIGPAADLCREGAGIKPIGADNLEQSFTRRMSAIGAVQDTGSNEQDFVLVSPAGNTVDRSQAALGAPGPQNLSSLVDRYHNLFQTSTLEAVYDPTPVGNGMLGTISLRQRLTNNSNVPLTRLRLRVTDITTVGTNQRVPGRPDVRALTSPEITVTLPGGSESVTLRGVTLEEVPLQALGGGLNSSLRIEGVSPATPLLPGQTVHVHLLLGVQRWGRYRFQVVVEAMP